MRRATRANDSTPTAPTILVEVITQAQARYALEEFALLNGWAEFIPRQKQIRVLDRPRFEALKRQLKSTPQLVPHLNRVVRKMLWCEGKRRLASPQDTDRYHEAMAGLNRYKPEYKTRGQVSGKSPVLNGAMKPCGFTVSNQEQNELILEEFRGFYGSPEPQYITPRPKGQCPRGPRAGEWKRQFKRFDEERTWSRAFPEDTLGDGTLLSLILIRLCSTEQDWVTFTEKWSAVEGGVELPELVTNLRFGQQQKQESASA